MHSSAAGVISGTDTITKTTVHENILPKSFFSLLVSSLVLLISVFYSPDCLSPVPLFVGPGCCLSGFVVTLLYDSWELLMAAGKGETEAELGTH